MIGLQFIANTFGVEYKDIANTLGVSPATIQDWLKERRKIPERRLEQLSEMFHIEKENFQKELSPAEMITIQLKQVERLRDASDVQIEDAIFTDVFGNQFRGTEYWNPMDAVVELHESEREKAVLFEDIEKLLSDDNSSNINLLSGLVGVLTRGNASERRILEVVMFYIINHDSEFGEVEQERYKRFRGLFEKLDQLLK